MWFSKSGSPHDGDKAEKRDGIHWRMPTAMAVCWLIGVGLAIGHHFYYYSLNGTIVPGQSQQEWSLRIGTGLAFLTKTFLTTAVGIACVQNLWWILRLKPVRLSTLDSMWDIRGSIFNFFDPFLWVRGPNVAILGLISWCIPLVTVVTPSTLSVQSTTGSVIRQQQMPAIDYDFVKFYTMGNGGPAGQSPSISRLVTGGMIQGTVPNIPAPAANSSYTLSFSGPLIQCSNSSDNVTQAVYDFAHKNYAQYTSFLAFEVETDNVTYGLYRALYPENNQFIAEYNGDRNGDIAGKTLITIWPYMGADRRWVVECGMYNASYTVNFNFTNGVQTTTITDLEVLGRVRSHRQHELPKPPNEEQLFAYTGMMDAFRDVLAGRCTANPSHCSDTRVVSSALVNSQAIWDLVFGDVDVGNTTYNSLGNFLDVISELGRNLTLNFFGNPYFLNTTNGPTVDVYYSPNQNEYLYSQKNLLIAYGVSVFISLLCIIAGFLTMWDNGFAFTDSFSTILRATRNPRFDEIVPQDSTTGSDPPPEALARTRVQWVGLPSAASASGYESGRGREDGLGVAGLRPLSALAETEKGTGSGRGSANGGGEGERSPRSPIAFANRIRERKNYQATATVASVQERSPDGFI